MSEQYERLRTWWRGALPPGRTTPLTLLMVQGTRFCNIDCAYCYLPRRSEKSTFDVGLLERFLDKIDAAGLIGERLTVLWHAGEPLVLKPDYYRDAFERIEKRLAGVTRVEHHIQTNAMLVTDAWCDLFKAFDVKIGVSLDGPQAIHDARRVTRDGKGTFERGMAGIRRLQAKGVPFTAIAVLNAESLKAPDEIYDFFRDSGFRQVGFNVEELEGANHASGMKTAEYVAAYAAFMRRVLERSLADGGRMEIREFAQRAAHLMRVLVPSDPASLPVTMEAVPFSILSLDVEGKVFTWSPELVDLTDAEGRDFSIGTVDDIDFATVHQQPRFADLAGQIDRGVELCRQTCGYFDVCGGGAPSNKLGENGSFASTETLFCRLTKKTVVDVIETATAEALERRRAARRAPPRLTLAPAPARPARPAQPSADTLAPGVRVFAPDLSTRLRVASGSKPAGDGYKTTARVPREDWRAPSPAEAAMLRAGDRRSGPLDFVAVVRPPEELVADLMEAGARIAAGPFPPAELAALHAPDAMRGPAERLNAFCRGALQALRPMGYAISEPASTITVDRSDGARMGLHLDSWSRLPVMNRGAAPNRICLNIGPEPREFLFVNLPLPQIAARLRAAGVPVDESDPTGMGRAFLAAFPRYPVLSLRVDPGEAYVAATENVIHDGRMDRPGVTDVTFTVLGRFGLPAPAAPRAAANQREA